MAVPEPLSAAILCGGSARRMGGVDKGQLVVGGRSILDRLADAVRPLADDLMLVDRQARRAAPPGFRQVCDDVDQAGVLGGLYTALAHAARDRVIVVACDMPFVTTAFLVWLTGRAADADVVIPRDELGRHPVCGVFHRRIAPVLRARIEAQRLRVDDALAGLAVREVSPGDLAPFDEDGHLLLNVNTPAEYAQATSGYDTP